MSDDEVESLEGIANTLRGIFLDPRVPKETQDVLLKQAERIERLVQKYSE